VLKNNGLRYPRWGGDGEAVQPEKGRGVENAQKMVRIPSVGPFVLTHGVGMGCMLC